MGGRAGQTQTQTSTTTLPTNQQQNVDTLQNAAGSIFASGGPQFFPGQTYADPTQQEKDARTGMANYATGAGQQLVNQYQAGEKYFLDPNNIFNPSNIPGFRAAQEGVTKQVTDNLQRNILTGIRGSNVSNGTYGGSRGGVTEGLAIGDTSAALGRTLADMNMQAYNSGLGMYNNAAARAPTTYGLGLQPSQTLNTVGEANRSDIQKGIDEQVQRFNFNELRPLLNAQALQSLTGTAGQYGGTTSTIGTSNVSGGNSGLLQGVGGLMTLIGTLYGKGG